MVELGYTKIGTGKKTIIVLHELMGDSRNYDAIHPYLDTIHFTYIFVDLRGYGKSKHLQGEYTVDESANDVSTLINSLQLKQVHLLAHSMSTMIAQKIALLDNRIKQLILITPISAAGIKMKPPAQTKLIHDMQKDENKIEQIVRSSSKRYNNTWKNYRINMAYISSTLEARVGYMKMYLTTNFINKVHNITAPIYIMVGKHDLPAFQKLTIKKQYEPYYNNFEIIQCEEAGHYPMIECPVFFATNIEKIVNSFYSIKYP